MNDSLITKKFDASLQKLALNFHSGNDVIDQYLRSFDSLNPSYGTTYVWLSDDENRIIGYYNFTMSSVCGDDNTFGAVYINYFAIDVDFREWGTTIPDTQNKVRASDMLFWDCMDRLSEIRDNVIGFTFIVLNATDEGLHLYERNGFNRFDGDITCPSITPGGTPLNYNFALEE